MIVTFWLDGESLCGYRNEMQPQVGDRVLIPGFGTSLVATERWYGGEASWSSNPGWHIVLRRPDTPAERTPPWKRGEVEG